MKEKTKFAETLYGMMSDENIFLTYFGDISPDITNALLKIVKYDTTNFGEKVIIKKKIYKIIVECLENIGKHSSGLNKERKHPAVLLLGKQENYFVITGNYIHNKEIPPLKKEIDAINDLNRDQIKHAYNKVLAHGAISVKGGAGLGIIDIALKANNKLVYDFIAVDETVSFYILRVEINISKNPFAN